MKNVLNFMQRWGLTLLGIVLIMCGLIYSAIPQTTPYQEISKAFLVHYLSGRGIGYMQLEKSSSLYIVNEGDYIPAFSADYLNHGNVLISFLYRSDETTSIDVSSDNHVHLGGSSLSCCANNVVSSIRSAASSIQHTTVFAKSKWLLST